MRRRNTSRGGSGGGSSSVTKFSYVKAALVEKEGAGAAPLLTLVVRVRLGASGVPCCITQKGKNDSRFILKKV